MIEAARDKLAEAQFFLHQMRAEERVVMYGPTNDPDGFDHYLSAFVSAARSVIWVLNSEEHDKWLVWEPIWKSTLTEEEQRLLKFTNEQRIAEVKRKGANKTRTYLTVPLSSKNPAFGDVKVHVHHFDFDGTRTEVTELCQRYLNLLERAVQDFLKAHDLNAVHVAIALRDLEALEQAIKTADLSEKTRDDLDRSIQFVRYELKSASPSRTTLSIAKRFLSDSIEEIGEATMPIPAVHWADTLFQSIEWVLRRLPR